MVAVTAALSVATAVTQFAAANAVGISAISKVADIYSSVKGTEAAQKAAAEQKKLLNQKNKEEAAAIADANAKALEKRKQLIDRQRKQLIGAGDTGYNINPTGSLGAPSVVSPSSSGTILG